MRDLPIAATRPHDALARGSCLSDDLMQPVLSTVAGAAAAGQTKGAGACGG